MSSKSNLNENSQNHIKHERMANKIADLSLIKEKQKFKEGI